MELSDFYRRSTKDESVFLKIGEIVIKNPEAVLDMMEQHLPDIYPTRQKIVLTTLVIQQGCSLTTYQAMELWRQLDKAEHDAMLGR